MDIIQEPDDAEPEDTYTTGSVFSVDCSYTNDPTGLVQFATINLTYPDQRPGGGEARECSLSWCAKTYEDTTMVNRTLSLEPSSTFYLVADNTGPDYNSKVTDTQIFSILGNETGFSCDRTFYLNIVDFATLAYFLVNILTTRIFVVENAHAIGVNQTKTDSYIAMALL